MPINPIVLQRRHAELGRIRLGQKVPGKNRQGDDITRPGKLAEFRFTSPSERYIKDIATLYGGEARPWDNGGKPEWEVLTSAKSIPVIVIKGGLSQWLETWSGGGCVHRCDGVTDHTDKDHLKPCNERDPKHRDAKPTTRLSVMLPELEAIGAWRMESHGWNAAAEIPAVAELAQYVGEMVPAHLNLVERRTVKDGKTSRFVVPLLDLQIGTGRLREIVAAKAGLTQISGPPTVDASRQIETPERTERRWQDMADDATTPEECSALWHQAGAVGQLTEGLKAHITQRVEDIKATVRTVASSVLDDETVDAEIEEEETPPWPSRIPDIPDDDADDPAASAWSSVVFYGGSKGWTTTALTDAFERFAAIPLSDATAENISDFQAALKRGQIDKPEGE